jgi:hypothetical protein
MERDLRHFRALGRASQAAIAFDIGLCRSQFREVWSSPPRALLVAHYRRPVSYWRSQLKSPAESRPSRRYPPRPSVKPGFARQKVTAKGSVSKTLTNTSRFWAQSIRPFETDFRKSLSNQYGSLAGPTLSAYVKTTKQGTINDIDRSRATCTWESRSSYPRWFVWCRLYRPGHCVSDSYSGAGHEARSDCEPELRSR